MTGDRNKTATADRRCASPLSDDEHWMRLAIGYANEAASCGEVPVGALIVGADGFLAGSGNGPIASHDPTAHAEILVLRAAAGLLNNYRLPATTLYVTLEPCVMCMGALIHARVERLVYGAADPKTGAAGSIYTIGSDGRLNHDIIIEGGVLSEQCAALLKDFFRAKRRDR